MKYMSPQMMAVAQVKREEEKEAEEEEMMMMLPLTLMLSQVLREEPLEQSAVMLLEDLSAGMVLQDLSEAEMAGMLLLEQLVKMEMQPRPSALLAIHGNNGNSGTMAT